MVIKDGKSHVVNHVIGLKDVCYVLPGSKLYISSISRFSRLPLCLEMQGNLGCFEEETRFEGFFLQTTEFLLPQFQDVNVKNGILMSP